MGHLGERTEVGPVAEDARGRDAPAVAIGVENTEAVPPRLSNEGPGRRWAEGLGQGPPVRTAASARSWARWAMASSRWRTARATSWPWRSRRPGARSRPPCPPEAWGLGLWRVASAAIGTGARRRGLAGAGPLGADRPSHGSFDIEAQCRPPFAWHRARRPTPPSGGPGPGHQQADRSARGGGTRPCIAFHFGR